MARRGIARRAGVVKTCEQRIDMSTFIRYVSVDMQATFRIVVPAPLFGSPGLTDQKKIIDTGITFSGRERVHDGRR